MAEHELDLERVICRLLDLEQHGALSEKETGRCIAGPCEGQTLRAVPVRVLGAIVIPDADATALAAQR